MNGILEHLINEVQEMTGFSDFGNYNDHELWLSLLLEEFMHIGSVPPQLVRYRMMIALSERLRVVAANNRCPMLDRDPVFVIGVPRTGTTLLYELLNACTGLRALTGAETRHPALRNDPEAQTEAVEWYRMADRMIPALRTIHPRSYDRPEELHWLTEHTLQSIAYPIQFPMWGYNRIVEAEPFDGPLRFVRDCLEVIDHEAQWVLKDPTGLGHLADYMKMFPKARFVWMHRDPLFQVRSMCSLVSETHMGTVGEVGDDIAYRVLTKTVTDLFAGAQADMSNPGRIMHVEMEDLVAAPIDVLQKVSEFFGVKFDDDNAFGVGKYLDNNPRPDHKYGGNIGGLNDDLILGVLGGLR